MEKIVNPNQTLNKRTNAALFDAACFAFLFFIINLLLSLIVTRGIPTYVDSFNVTSEHIESCGLCKIDTENNNYLQYDQEDLVLEENGNLVFVNALSYYYLNYLSNTNIKPDCVGSKEVIVHDIKWFNENILEIGKSDIFKTKSDNVDSVTTELGVFNESYVNTNGQESVHTFIMDKYNEAVENFNNLSFMQDANRIMNTFNYMVLLISTLSALAIVYVLVPVISKMKQTFGKRIFKIVVVRDEDLVTNKIILLRVAFAALVCALISFVNNMFAEIIIVIFALLVSTGFMIFTKSNSALHDFLARTRVISLDKYIEMKTPKEEQDGNQSSN